MKKNIGLCIFLLIHFYYINRLLSNGVPVFEICFLIVMVTLAYIWGFGHYHHNPAVDSSRIPSSVISASIGGVCCYGLSQQTGPILACGIVGLLASFLTQVFKDKKYHELPYSTYCGCFVGMSAHAILPDMITVSILAGFSGFLFAMTKRSLEGVGGRLGSISFASVVCYLFIHNYM
jgi:hypothetical protein